MRNTVAIVSIVAMLAGAAFGQDVSRGPLQVSRGPLQLVKTIPMGGVDGRIDHLAYDAVGGRLIVAALENDSVEVIDVAAGRRVKSLTGPREPQGVCVIGDSRTFVVASGRDGTCRLYDAAFNVVAKADGLDDADNVRYASGDGREGRVYAGYGDGALAVLDPRTLAKVGEVALKGHPESFQLERSGKRLFVNVPSAGHVAVVDREKGAVVDTWPVREAKANFPMALDEADHRLFVGCRQPALLLVKDTDSGKTVAAVPCAGDADDLYYDPKSRLVFVSGGAGQVSVFRQDDPDHYSRAGTVPTAAGARTSLFVADSGTLFVAVPHRGGQAAEVREYRVVPGPAAK